MFGHLDASSWRNIVCSLIYVWTFGCITLKNNTITSAMVMHTNQFCGTKNSKFQTIHFLVMVSFSKEHHCNDSMSALWSMFGCLDASHWITTPWLWQCILTNFVGWFFFKFQTIHFFVRVFFLKEHNGNDLMSLSSMFGYLDASYWKTTLCLWLQWCILTNSVGQNISKFQTIHCFVMVFFSKEHICNDSMSALLLYF